MAWFHNPDIAALKADILALDMRVTAFKNQYEGEYEGLRADALDSQWVSSDDFAQLVARVEALESHVKEAYEIAVAADVGHSKADVRALVKQHVTEVLPIAVEAVIRKLNR